MLEVLALSAGNYIYQFFFGGDYMLALKISLAQAVAIFAYYTNNKMKGRIK